MLPQRLRAIVKNLSWLRERPHRNDRAIALKEEIQYWKRWFKTRGSGYPRDFDSRFNPSQPIQEHVATYIDRLEANCVRILDVGSGPLTKLGKKHPSKHLKITATDLLAEEYDRLLEELGIDPLLRTIYADAERLVERFGRDTYDIVHGQNCIDHTANPLRAIKQMLAVCKPEGFVVLFHAENEGEREQYRQLHQWNFNCRKGSFVIGDMSGRETNVTKSLAALGDVECTRLPDGDQFAILTGIQKKFVRQWGRAAIERQGTR